MAEVQIKITGKQSSRVTIKYAPAECQNKEGYVSKASMTTHYGKADWESIATDERAPYYVATTLGVSVDDLRTGIVAMTEEAKQHAPGVYRAWCGKEMFDRRDGVRKPKKISEVWMGHEGDERHPTPSMRVADPVPESCANCQKLKAHPFNYLARDDYEGPGAGDFFSQIAYVCRTFTLIPGAVPPPKEEVEAPATEGAR